MPAVSQQSHLFFYSRRCVQGDHWDPLPLAKFKIAWIFGRWDAIAVWLKLMELIAYVVTYSLSSLAKLSLRFELQQLVTSSWGRLVLCTRTPLRQRTFGVESSSR
jgi:hypothetical protein